MCLCVCCRYITAVPVRLTGSRLWCCIVYETTALCRRMCCDCIYGHTRRSLRALQRLDRKHVVVCRVSLAPDLHGRFTSPGSAVVLAVYISCLMLVSCYCSYTTWTDMFVHSCLMWMLVKCLRSCLLTLLAAAKTTKRRA